MKTNFTKQKKQEWIDALRSGKYKQTDSVLHDGHGAFCCLGVLCDITPDMVTKTDGGFMCKIDGNLTMSALPDSLANKYGITNFGLITNTDNNELAEYGIKNIVNNSLEVVLSDLNDRGMSFIEIAGVIEKHFETID